MFSAGTLSVLEFSGHDAGQFLHNQLSADIAAIPIGGSGFACCCNPAGRVIGLLLVAVQRESILAICSSGLAQPLSDWLSRFIIRADVKIGARPDLVVVVQLSGEPVSEGVSEGISVETASGLNYGILPSSAVRPDGNDEAAKDWHFRELESGVAWLSPETSAQFLPQMLGYETIEALSFKKGCYPGQEIIARMRYLGNLKRRPLLLRTGGLEPVGLMDKVTVHVGDSDFSAVVVDTARSAAGENLLFTVVRTAEDIQPDAVTVNEVRFNI